MSILKDLDPSYAKIHASSAREVPSGKLATPLLALTALACASLAWLAITNTSAAQPRIQLATAKTTQVIAGSTTSAIDTTPLQNPPEQSALIRNQQISSPHGGSSAYIIQAPASAQQDQGSSSVKSNAQQGLSSSSITAAERHRTVAPQKTKGTKKKISQKSRIRNQASKREMKPEQRDIDIISAIVK